MKNLLAIKHHGDAPSIYVNDGFATGYVNDGFGKGSGDGSGNGYGNGCGCEEDI